MADDDVLQNELMPNNGEVAAPGVYVPDDAADEPSHEERVEESLMAVSEPIIEDILAWFDEQIATSDSVEQVHKTKTTYSSTIEEAMVAHDIVRNILENGKDELMSRYDDYRKKREAEDGVGA